MNITPSTQKVLEVTDLDVQVIETFPPQLHVNVFGTVPSPGWTNPQLIPFTYVQAPPDGIYDFDFVATPPIGIITKVISPIRLRTDLPGEGVNGIRIHASLNFKKVILNTAEAPSEVTQKDC